MRSCGGLLGFLSTPLGISTGSGEHDEPWKNIVAYPLAGNGLVGVSVADCIAYSETLPDLVNQSLGS